MIGSNTYVINIEIQGCDCVLFKYLPLIDDIEAF